MPGWMCTSRPPARCSRTAPIPTPTTSPPRSTPPVAPRPAGPPRRSSSVPHLLQRLADLIEARLEEFAALESRDSGKPLSRRAPARHSARGQQPALFRGGDHQLGQRVARDGKRRRRHRRDQLHTAPAAWRGRLHQPVEPAAVPVQLEDRAGAGRRQHGGGQAIGSHPVHRRPARRAEHRGRLSARRAEHRAGPRPQRGPGHRRTSRR